MEPCICHLCAYFVFVCSFLTTLAGNRGASDIQGVQGPTGAVGSLCTHRPPAGGFLGLTIHGLTLKPTIEGAIAGTKGLNTIPTATPNADPHITHS